MVRALLQPKDAPSRTSFTSTLGRRQAQQRSWSPILDGPSTSIASLTPSLNQDRAPRAVSFGRVRWYGRPGELLLAGGGANGGGEEAGHVIFAFTAGGIGYDISLHAWASKERITVHGVTYVVTAPQPGPALPHVIATLKAIVGSTPQG